MRLSREIAKTVIAIDRQRERYFSGTSAGRRRLSWAGRVNRSTVKKGANEFGQDSGRFLAAVWKAPQDVDAIDRFVLDDSSLPRAASMLFFEGQFKDWVTQFFERVTDLKFEVVETFQNEDVSRVALAGQSFRMSGTVVVTIQG